MRQFLIFKEFFFGIIFGWHLWFCGSVFYSSTLFSIFCPSGLRIPGFIIFSLPNGAVDTYLLIPFYSPIGAADTCFLFFFFFLSPSGHRIPADSLPLWPPNTLAHRGGGYLLFKNFVFLAHRGFGYLLLFFIFPCPSGPRIPALIFVFLAHRGRGYLLWFFFFIAHRCFLWMKKCWFCGLLHSLEYLHFFCCWSFGGVWVYLRLWQGMTLQLS